MRITLFRSRHKPHLRTTAEIVQDNLLSPFHALMLACTVILLIFGAEPHQLTFLFFVVLNAALRIFYDLSARNAVRRIERPDPPRTVLRNGGIVRDVRSTGLEEGDVLMLRKGDLAPTDCRLLAGEPMVMEALITGRNQATHKVRGDKIYGESTILFDTCCVQVIEPAAHSLAAYMTEIAPPHHARRAEIDIGKQRLVLMLGSVSVVLAVWKVVAMLLHGETVSDALIYGATMITSLVPVMWLLLSSFSLYLSARTLRKKNAAARDLYCVEMLARTDMICFDKTGTITLRALGGELREDIDALEFFHREGIPLRIISGDTVESVSAVLAATTHGGKVYDCRLAYEDPTLLERAALEYTGFAEATAAQKAMIIRALRHAGYTVAMVGDGANDVPALRAADCSICFGSGADEVRAASNIVLLDNHLSALPDIVLEGRRVINNITRTGELFIKKSLCTFVLYLLVLTVGFSYPYHNEHWSVLNLFCVIIPAAVLVTERQHQHVHGHFLHNVISEAMPGALLHILYIIAAVQLSAWMGLDESMTLTLCCGIAGAAGLGVLWHICAFPLDRLRRILCISMTVLLPVALAVTGPYLHLAAPTWNVLLAMLPFALIAFPLMHLFVRTFAHIEHALRLPTHAAHTVHARKNKDSHHA